MMRPELVVFDIGNVLIEWQPERFFSREVGPERSAAFFANVPIHRIHHRVDSGALFATILEAIDDYPEFAPELQLWHDGWSRLAGTPIPHSIRLLRALRSKGIPVWALTNFGEEPFEISCNDHDFLTEFDGAVVSGRIGIAKPDAGIYEALEDAVETPRSKILFADDRAENIAAAKARGWQTHLFETPAGWADRLVSDDLLSRKDAQ